MSTYESSWQFKGYVLIEHVQLSHVSQKPKSSSIIFRIVDIDKQVAADISSVEIRNDGVSVSDHPLGSLKANFQLLCIGI